MLYIKTPHRFFEFFIPVTSSGKKGNFKNRTISRKNLEKKPQGEKQDERSNRDQTERCERWKTFRAFC